MLVYVGKQFACVKIVGRANFNFSLDFKTLLTELGRKGYSYFVIDLSECALMDSTFLGILAGFGLNRNGAGGEQSARAVELLDPNPRIAELLENLGVLELFRIKHGPASLTGAVESCAPAPCEHSREDVTRACLEAHETLIALNPGNVAKFKEVAQFLAEDLKKLEQRK